MIGVGEPNSTHAPAAAADRASPWWRSGQDCLPPSFEGAGCGGWLVACAACGAPITAVTTTTAALLIQL